MVSPPTNHFAFPELERSVNSGRCVAFIGAGLSRPKYPSWAELIETIRNECDVNEGDCNLEDSLEVAETAKRKNEKRYLSTLRHIFKPKTFHKKSHRDYHLLYRIPFVSYLTTNFESLLPDVFELHRNIGISKYPWLDVSLHKEDKEIFYIHGQINPNGFSSDLQVVLTQSEFKKAYDPRKTMLTSFLQQTLLTHDVCFIGCSFSDEYLRSLLNICLNIRDEHWPITTPNPPKWFALAEQDESLPSNLNECGIHEVLFEKANKEYIGLTRVLEYLAGCKPPDVRRPEDHHNLYGADGEPPR